MTRSNDDALVSYLREHTLAAVPPSGLDAGAVLAASRRKRTAALAVQVSVAVVAVGLGVVGVAALGGTEDRTTPPVGPAPTTSVSQVPTPSAPSVSRTPSPPATEPTMCAEFPGSDANGPSYEGWWSSSPADDDGTILTDPADWPAIMREHPRTVLIDTRTGSVIESFDRYACGPVAEYQVPADLDLPPDAVVVVDAVTGETLETMSPPAFPPQP